MVYLVSISGFLTNAVMDIPLMLLFNKLDYLLFLGSIVSSILGFSISVIVGLVSLHRSEKKINFKFLFTTIVKSLIPITIMVLILMGIEIFLPINNNFLKIIVYGIVGGITYIGISYSMGILTELFGKRISK